MSGIIFHIDDEVICFEYMQYTHAHTSVPQVEAMLHGFGCRVFFVFFSQLMGKEVEKRDGS